MAEAQKEDRRSRDRRVRRTKRAIREALTELAQERDFEKISVAAVARVADIDRKTFYLHYRSVDEVVDELMREEAELIVAAVREELLSERDGVDVGDLFAKLSVNLAQDLARRGHVADHTSIEVVLRKIEGPLTEALIEEDSLGLAAMGPYLGYCVSFFIAGVLAVYRRWLVSDSEIPLEDLAAMAGTAAFAGVNGLLGDNELAKMAAAS